VILRDGGVIAEGYDVELDDLRRISNTAINIWWIWKHANANAPALQVCDWGSIACRATTLRSVAVNPIKCRWTITPSDGEECRALHHAGTQQFEDKVLGARDKSLAREKELYDQLLDKLIERLLELQAPPLHSPRSMCWRISPNVRSRSILQTELVDEALLDIKEARHPVVEQFIDGHFVPNDLSLDEQRRMLIITGPHGR